MEEKNIHELNILTLRETAEEQSHDFNQKTFDDYLGQKELKEKR